MGTALAAEAVLKFYDTELQVDVVGPRKMITLLGSDGNEIFSISETVVTGWLLIILLYILIRWLTKDLKVKPTSKKQVLAEWFVTFFNNLVKENMGSRSGKACALHCHDIYICADRLSDKRSRFQEYDG